MRNIQEVYEELDQRMQELIFYSVEVETFEQYLPNDQEEGLLNVERRLKNERLVQANILHAPDDRLDVEFVLR